MTISDAIDEYLDCKKNAVTHKTFIWYEARLKFLLTWATEHDITDLKDITTPIIQHCISDVQTTNSYTRRGYAQVFKTFLLWCSLEDSGVKERTVKRIEMPKLQISEIYLFTDKDIESLIRACDKVPYPNRAKAIVHLLLDTGIRVSELAYDNMRPQEETGLRMEHVYLGRDDESYIRVMGKGRKTRSLSVGDATRIALKRYIKRERGNNDSPYVFLSRLDEPLSVRMCEQIISDLGDLAGVHPCRPHLFRHFFAVRSLLSGVSEVVLMKLLGHTSLEATKVYIRAMTEEQARKIAPSIIDKLLHPNKAKRR